MLRASRSSVAASAALRGSRAFSVGRPPQNVKVLNAQLKGDGIEVRGTVSEKQASDILSPAALNFVANLHRKFNPKREALLQERRLAAQRIAAGELPDFLPETKAIRDSEWTVAEIPADLQDRRKLYQPTERVCMKCSALPATATAAMAAIARR